MPTVSIIQKLFVAGRKKERRKERIIFDPINFRPQFDLQVQKRKKLIKRSKFRGNNVELGE